ncbi:MAG: hypothetical protein KGP35_02885 [Bacteroidetes bacterium]|nr:hypothetical protein [Bacteroidota bacterium]
MRKIKKPIRSLRELDREIFHLEQEVKRLEMKLGNNYHHIKEHFPQLLLASAFRRQEKMSIPAMVLGLFLKNEKIQELIQSFTDQIADKGAHWMEKIFKKKEE